MSDRCISAH